MIPKRLAVSLTVVLVLPTFAQAQKKALTQADWDKWKSITTPALSPDGKWAVYTLVPQVGDGELVIRSTSSATEYHVPRGFLGRPNNVPGGLRPPAGASEEGEAAGPNASPPQITDDSRFVIVETQPNQAEVERAGRSRAAANAANRRSLAIVSLADGKVTNIPGVRSFRLPHDSGKWLAYVAEPDSGAPAGEGAPAAAAGGGAGRGGRGGRGGAGGAAGGRRQFGSMLVLRNLAAGTDEKIPDVLTFAFDDSAKVLAYTVVARDSTKDGAFLRNLASNATTTLLSGAGDYKNVVFNRAGTELVFVSDKDEFGHMPKPHYAMYEASTKGGAATQLVGASQVTPGMHIADAGAIAFTRSGSAITFNVAPPPIDSVPSDSLVGKSVFDLWNYKDRVLQPTQRINAQRDRNKSYQAVYYPATKRFVQLADDSIPQVQLSDDAKVGVANSRERYMIESMWGDGGTDVYVIDPSTNARKLIREKINGNAQLSPEGKYVSFYDHNHWYSYNIATGKTTDLTGAGALKDVHFDNETDDHPAAPPAWGLAGWTKNDAAVLIYDRYDIWQLDPNNAKPAVNLTGGFGRKNTIQLRLAEGGRGGRGGGAGRGGRGGAAGGDDRGIVDTSEPVMLHAMNTETMASGFYREPVGGAKEPEKIVMADLAFGTPIKASDANEWMI
ncbi:MAG TPA: hypothetical protein VGM50_13880, partial [Gemmatimonadaceae bacterium]